MASTYPIGAVARMTGLPVDTLRAWERRYGAVTPRRSSRGRLYNEQQVKRLILLREATQSGHAIGGIAKLGELGLRELLDGADALTERPRAGRKEQAEELLDPILRAIGDFDYARADRELNRVAAVIANARELVHRVALPLMRIMGERWHEGKCTIAQEHMLTALLSALLASFIRAYTPTNPPARVLFATPRSEHHGFPNLAAAMLAAAGGLGVIPLGTDVPTEDLLLAVRKSRTNALLLSMSKTPERELLKEILELGRKAHKTTALWLGGPPQLALERATQGSRWKVLHDFAALEGELTGLGARF